MTIRVECYAGHRAEQEPTALWLGGRRVQVREIVDRWYAPGQRWFKVDGDDGRASIVSLPRPTSTDGACLITSSIQLQKRAGV